MEYRLSWLITVLVFAYKLPCLCADIVDVKNAALQKPAIQSSTFRDNVEVFGARLANDESPQTCAKTQWSWMLFWRVDLMDNAAVAGANITLRWEYFGSVDNRFLYQVELQVGDENIPLASSCGTEALLLDKPNEYNIEIVCQNVTVGRFVTINVTPSYAGTVTTGSPQLTLCDVKVFTVVTDTSSGVAADSSGGNDALVASSHTSELIAEDDPKGGSGLSYLHSDSPSTESNMTHSLSDRGSRTTTPKRKVFREIVTKTKIERLLRGMKTPVSATTPRRESVMADDDDQRHNMGPTPNLEITSDEGALALEVMALKEDMNAKLRLMQHYVVFSSVAVGILLLLGLSIGIYMIWRLTSSAATGEIQPGSSQEFSFKSPPSPSPQVALKTLHRPGTFKRVTEFPKDCVPKDVRHDAFVARGLMF
ncbi:hypothetical protein RvY_10358 [Ramazzottius varieornatus]|uniref:Fucolectin tachylectin-4 pentraxin-1 domain-containing protein n=1 Tax=Ramazzottius varieornatus TaxID=947166 RepID=A0A1D1VCI0_RAMVA|nr:hypothetical protein RvY_10358 [Ramazzottius varieornatus]